MDKYLTASFLLLTSLSASANDFNQDLPIKPEPKMAITLDYIPATQDMYGITLAPSHYDREYADWGYYIGYARSQEETLAVPEPGEAYAQDTMWRFGLSYTLTANFSLYGGASALISEVSSTDNIVPDIVGGEPVWEREKDTRWGVEAGLRFTIGENLMLGAGYNSASQSAVFSIGYTM